MTNPSTYFNFGSPAANKLFIQLSARAKQRKRRILFPESLDARILSAVDFLHAHRIVDPVLIGDRESSLRVATKHTLSMRVLQNLSKHIHFEDLQDGKSALETAIELLKSQAAHGIVTGASMPTRAVLRTALRHIPVIPGIRYVSSSFLMVLQRPTEAGANYIAFADCAVIPHPTAEQLADIACATAAQYRKLVRKKPIVAFVSYSTHSSATHPSNEHIRDACAILRKKRLAFIFDGELQIDAALVPSVCKMKSPKSPVKGRANVIIFPDLNAGNIGYKLVERLAGAQAIGPIIQGFKYPINDLSRGCSVEDIILLVCITALQAA